MTRVPSQNDRILTLLSDRQPHRVPDIHQAVGTCRLNSRIAELRKRLRSQGLTIVCHHLGGTGAEAYAYQVVLLETDPCRTTPVELTSHGSVSSGAASTDPGSAAITAAAPLAQLTLEDELGKRPLPQALVAEAA